MTKKYYLKFTWEDDWREVTKEQFIQAEQDAGFHSRFGPTEAATDGLGNGSIQGNVVHMREGDEE